MAGKQIPLTKNDLVLAAKKDIMNIISSLHFTTSVCKINSQSRADSSAYWTPVLQRVL